MDVHSKNYTLCAMEPTIGAEDRIFGEVQVAPELGSWRENPVRKAMEGQAKTGASPAVI